MACQKYLNSVLAFDWSIPDPWGALSPLSLADLQSIRDKICQNNHMHCFTFNFDNKRRQMPTLPYFCFVEITPNEVQFHISLLIKEFSNVVLSFESNFDASVKYCTGLCRQITRMWAAQHCQLSVQQTPSFVTHGFQCLPQLFSARSYRYSYIHCKS